jgi:hypothetical protein
MPWRSDGSTASDAFSYRNPSFQMFCVHIDASYHPSPTDPNAAHESPKGDPP